jgi:hypothetical protein
MQTDDLTGDIEAFRKVGIEMKLVPGERVRPDGFKIINQYISM